MEIGDDLVEALRAELVAWYRAHRRDLPWRRTRDPYAVWISEAMLQQTRVETVVPYYERFLARLPSLADLAAADEEEVVALWSGLGYYRRARALRAAARAVVDLHGGRFPAEREDALALPGIGPYTAGAVLSIAYGRSEALVDGNVTRVLARLFEREDPVGSTTLRREAWELAERLVPPEEHALDPGDWNQALMELGALVCTPREPACGACPLAARCRARIAGRSDELPRPAKRVPSVEVRLETLLVERDGSVLLERRPATGRMAGMWELPTRELTDGRTPTRLWPREQRIARADGPLLGRVTHGITRHRIRVEVRRGGALDGVAGDPERRWARPGELEALALTGLARKVLSLGFASLGTEG